MDYKCVSSINCKLCLCKICVNIEPKTRDASDGEKEARAMIEARTIQISVRIPEFLDHVKIFSLKVALVLLFKI